MTARKALVNIDGITQELPTGDTLAGVVTDLPIASTTVLGGVKVDGTTITANSSGVITAIGGSGSTQITAFANFSITDGELVVEHLSTFLPSIVDGEFIVEYTPI